MNRKYQREGEEEFAYVETSSGRFATQVNTREIPKISEAEHELYEENQHEFNDDFQSFRNLIANSPKVSQGIKKFYSETEEAALRRRLRRTKTSAVQV